MPVIAEFLLGFSGPFPYLIVLGILLLCGFGLPIPEDITLIAAGILSFYGGVNVWGMIAVGMVGVLAGDGTMFFLGKRYGKSISKLRWFSKFLTEDRFREMQDMMQKRGNKLLFAARFMPGVRAPLFFTAGALGVRPAIFILYDGLAALISVPAIIYSVYYFGSHMDQVIAAIHGTNKVIVGILVVGALFAFFNWRRQRKKLESSQIARSGEDKAA